MGTAIKKFQAVIDHVAKHDLELSLSSITVLNWGSPRVNLYIEESETAIRPMLKWATSLGQSTIKVIAYKGNFHLQVEGPTAGGLVIPVCAITNEGSAERAALTASGLTGDVELADLQKVLNSIGGAV